MHLVNSLSDGKWFLNFDCMRCPMVPMVCLLTVSVVLFSVAGLHNGE
jgi:hypothetical protein